MQFVSLFSGIGGFEIPAEWMGWYIIAQCEIDPFCRKVLKKHWPDVYLHGDIKTLNREIIQEKTNWDATETTIIVGGFPCQPFSHAGKRKGSDDNRYLWPEYYRVIQELRPTYIVGENVAGLVTMENGTLFEKWIFIGMESKNYLRRIYSRHIYRTRQTFILNEICNDLEREDYIVESFIIPACGVGAWHRRDRIWIIAYTMHSRNGQQGEGVGQCETEFKFKEQESRSQYSEQSNKLFQSGIGKGEDVSDTQSQRLQKPTIKESQQGTPRTGFECGNLQPRGETEYWSTEPNVGGMASRIPKELAGYWDREPDIPRVAEGVKDRVNKLKALGNAVVPQIPYEIFLAIQKIEDEKQT